MTGGTAVAVIGTHYGDEGKGLVVDRLVRDLADPWVVRFNGGAQAGHTVTLADGRRHVFSHFGAGTLAGAPTFLSRFFVANPYLFLREAEELQAVGVAPRVVLDPRAPLTTPYEVLINRAIEEARGARRHGSCGVGFGETLEREEKGLSITAADLDADTQVDLDDASVVEEFIAIAAAFRECIDIADASVCAGKPVVLEGAQGLLLDQSLGAFPHVTRSYTGLPNVVALASELRLDAVEVFYTMRPYITRHGAGALAGELAAPPYAGIVDPTNRPNPFQGSLRFALADPDVSIDVISRDRARVAGGPIITPSLAVTCLDQLDGPILCAEGSTLEPDDFIEAIAGPIGARRVLLSHGPTAATARFAARRPVYRLLRVSAAPSASARSLA
jgi:adenylosuccinate synthase